jgi:hypothetical protein
MRLAAGHFRLRTSSSAHDARAPRSGNAGQFTVRGRFRGCVPDGERFPCLTFLFRHPLGPDPLICSFERHPYAENRSAGMATTYLIVIRHANAFLPGLAPAWRPRHQADLEAFMADCSPVGRPAPPPPSTRPSRSTSGCSLVRSATTATPLPTTLLSGSTRGALLPSEEWSREYCPR